MPKVPLIEFGNTRVLCTASVEDKVPPHQRGTGRGWVTAEYGMLPRATHKRKDREAASKWRTHRQIQRLIGRSLRAVFDLEALESASCSTVTCCRPTAGRAPPPLPARGGWCAQDAVVPLMARGLLARTPIRDAVAAVSGVARCAPPARPGLPRGLRLRHRT